jgi:uncharacterized protein
MVNTTSPKTDVDLRHLDAFLLSDRVADDAFDLSNLDGFLTGIAVGPELILPYQWLPIIWGSEEPDFECINQAMNIFGAVFSRYIEIIAHLDADPDHFDPVFWEGPEGEITAEDWAAGFLSAVRLRTTAWEPLARDPESRALLVPLLILGTEAEDRPPLDSWPLSAQKAKGRTENDPDVIRECVLGIRAFWSVHRAERSEKVRQNRRGPGPQPRCR